MPLLILDGPEAAGKTTIVEGLKRLVDPELTGRTFVHRRWGPVEGWPEYCGPLVEDLYEITRTPSSWVVWDRSWAAEHVYNDLMGRQRLVDEQTIRQVLEYPIHVSREAMMLMVIPPVHVLTQRRATRVKEGKKEDLNVDPEKEAQLFFMYGTRHRWNIVQQIDDPRQVVSMIDLRIYAHDREDLPVEV